MKDYSATKTVTAQQHVLDRLLYMLEENSVSHLAEQDKRFSVFVGNLYDAISAKMVQLQK